MYAKWHEYRLEPTLFLVIPFVHEDSRCMSIVLITSYLPQ